MKLDITEVLVDFGKFLRAAIWTELGTCRKLSRRFHEADLRRHSTNYVTIATFRHSAKARLLSKADGLGVWAEVQPPRLLKHLQCNQCELFPRDARFRPVSLVRGRLRLRIFLRWTRLG